MYLGRFLIVGPDVGAYRVSSRSFPHRSISDREGALTVGLTEDAPETDNPYVSYNCLRSVDGSDRSVAVFGNGSHVDPIAEKIELGYPDRDALVNNLLALDYEKDEYDTPRIAATLDTESAAYVGIVESDGLVVRRVYEPTLISTYERTEPTAIEFEVDSASDAAEKAYGLDFDHPICSIGVVRDGKGFETAVYNGPA